MKKVKIKIDVKAADGSQVARFESDAPHAKTPAPPLQTLISAAEHLARLAEAYEGAGAALAQAAHEASKDLRARMDAKRPM